MVDFERGAINAFEEVWPTIDPTGCHFHLSQNIFLKVRNYGLYDFYMQVSVELRTALPLSTSSRLEILAQNVRPTLSYVIHTYVRTYVHVRDCSKTTQL